MREKEAKYTGGIVLKLLKSNNFEGFENYLFFISNRRIEKISFLVKRNRKIAKYIWNKKEEDKRSSILCHSNKTLKKQRIRCI
jgi:hypothetical protein